MIGATGLRCPECGQTAIDTSALHRRPRRWRLAMVGLLIAAAAPGYEGYVHVAKARTQTDRLLAIAYDRVYGTRDIGGSAVGYDGGPSDYYFLMQVLLTHGTPQLYKAFLNDADAGVRTMGMVCLAQSDPAGAAVDLRKHLFGSEMFSIFPGGCVGYGITEGGFARELLHDANYLEWGAAPRPLLSPRDLLALDIEILADDRSADNRHKAAGFVGGAVEDGRLRLDLSFLQALVPELSPPAIVKAIGRLNRTPAITDALAACVNDSECDLVIRLAAASALSRTADAEVLALLERHEAPFNEAHRGNCGSRLVRDARAVMRYADRTRRLEAEPDRESDRHKQILLEAAAENHPVVLSDLLDLLPKVHEDERALSAVANSLLQIAGGLLDFDPEWNTFSDAVYVLKRPADEPYDDLFWMPEASRNALCEQVRACLKRREADAGR